MARAGFGIPKYGNSFKKTGKVVAGKNLIRIMPPMNSMAESGTWRVWRATHWGYSGNSTREPGRTVMRPFRCIRDADKRTGMVRQECPACVKFKGLEDEVKEREAELRANKKTEAEIKTAMHSINEEVRQYRSEAKHYVNVMLQDGSFCDFKLNGKDHMSRIRAIIEGTKEKPPLKEAEGLDALDPDEGVWFEITRNGDGVNPPDSVELAFEDVVENGRRLKALKPARLTDEQCARALKECPDLSTRGGAVLTYEQIDALVKCSGDPDEVDAIFGSNQPTTSEEGTDKDAPEEKAEDKRSEPAPAAKDEATKSSESATPPPAEEKKMSAADEERLKKILADRAAKKAKEAEEERLRKEAEAAAAAAKEAESDLSDDDFMKKYAGTAA